MQPEINGSSPSKTVVRSERINKPLIDRCIPRDGVDGYWPKQ